jgi:hypothetical protein
VNALLQHIAMALAIAGGLMIGGPSLFLVACPSLCRRVRALRVRSAARPARTARGRVKRREQVRAASHDRCGLSGAEQVEFRRIAAQVARGVLAETEGWR